MFRLGVGISEVSCLVFQKVRDLRAKACHARELADHFAGDARTVKNLISYAGDLDREADRLERELKNAENPK